jgi:hypothetical protein
MDVTTKGWDADRGYVNPNLLALVNTVAAVPEGKTRRLNELLDQPDDEDDYDPFEGMVDISEMLSDKMHPKLSPVPKMQGTTAFHKRIDNLNKKFVNIFSREVKQTPAHIPPLGLRLKPDSTFSETHRHPPRPQSVDHMQEIERQIELMLRQKVIERSRASAYSQVILAKKPNGKWRFCIDYRGLNKNLQTEFWVIPNIRELMQRIGAKKAKYYGVVDLTSGYHQAPLSKDSRELAAFVTHRGVYNPLRVPMGVHVAPAYFQRTIANTIMSEFLYDGMEMYIDDIIIYAGTEEEFLARLERLYKKCEQYNITLNPDKCTLGVEEIEYIGHVIDKDGLRMSDDKIRKVVDFAVPDTIQQMQSFLGLANYFRDHIQNHSTIAHPLYALYDCKAKGKTKLVWTDAATEAFTAMKHAIEQCPKLYFLDNDPEYRTVVETDASDFGIGAYMYQVKKGSDVQRPVAFLSKSLCQTEQRWSTIEKEQYAIFLLTEAVGISVTWNIIHVKNRS